MFLQKHKYEKKNSLCCGGSLGNLVLNSSERLMITQDVVSELIASNPDFIATACPLCKKTFMQVSDRKVLDIAEIVAKAIPVGFEEQERLEEIQILQEELV